VRHVVCLTLGTGVGSGIIADGRSSKGAGAGRRARPPHRPRGRADVRLRRARVPRGPTASAGAVAKRAEEALRMAGPAVRARCSPARVRRARSVGPRRGATRWRCASSATRRGSSPRAWPRWSTAFPPEVIVLTGGMIRARGGRAARPTRKLLTALPCPKLLAACGWSCRRSKDRAGVLGAAAVALSRAGRRAGRGLRPGDPAGSGRRQGAQLQTGPARLAGARRVDLPTSRASVSPKTWERLGEARRPNSSSWRRRRPRRYAPPPGPRAEEDAAGAGKRGELDRAVGVSGSGWKRAPLEARPCRPGRWGTARAG